VRTDAARNRTRILDAARAQIAAQGPDAAMDAIAGAAGVAVGTLYRHYPTKADLVAAVIEDSLGQFAAFAEAAARAVDDGVDALHELRDLMLAFAEQHTRDRALKAASTQLGMPIHYDIERYPDGSAARRAGIAVSHVLEAARGSGAVRADLTLEDLTMLLNGVPDDPAQRDRYVEIVLAGITRPPGS
jgi:AcrR family transcriptional regulator